MSSINQRPKDENGLNHGEWVNYYVNGGVFHRHNFVHGVLHGLWESYDYNGTLRYRGYLNMGKEIGYWHYHKGSSKYYLCLL